MPFSDHQGLCCELNYGEILHLYYLMDFATVTYPAVMGYTIALNSNISASTPYSSPINPYLEGFT